MDYQELKERQSWTLEQKIYHSLEVIDTFYQRMNGKCYVSFSGGKDSTVLLWLARKIAPNIRAVFCNTGNEYPDIVKFVRELKSKKGSRIEIIYPKIKPKDVVSKYGFPLVSKEMSEIIHYTKNSPDTITAKKGRGEIDMKISKKIPKKYEFLLKEDFEIHNICCDKLKKEPFYKYQQITGEAPILGIMADESRLRTLDYLKNGQCNVFNDKKQYKSKSMPLSIWVEKDIWDCIEKYDIPISDIYHKGAKRTGCMFCGYGCHQPDDNRLSLLYELYPKWYETFMQYENNGVTYREVLRKMLATNNLLLPDEKIL